MTTCVYIQKFDRYVRWCTSFRQPHETLSILIACDHRKNQKIHWLNFLNDWIRNCIQSQILSISKNFQGIYIKKIKRIWVLKVCILSIDNFSVATNGVLSVIQIRVDFFENMYSHPTILLQTINLQVKKWLWIQWQSNVGLKWLRQSWDGLQAKRGRMTASHQYNGNIQQYGNVVWLQ